MSTAAFWAACLPAAAEGPSDGSTPNARPTTRPATAPAKSRRAGTATQPSEMLPCPATSKPAGKPGQDDKGPPAAIHRGGDPIPRFAVNSQFADDSGAPGPTQKPEKILWAKSCLWDKAPELVVEKWLSAKPDTKGKYVLIEFWATWCPPCRKSISLLNGLHKKYGKDLVVIGISDEAEADVRKLPEKYSLRIEYFSAIDTRARMKKQLEVRGIPHVIILEPSEGVVIWEGFPFLKGYELTEDIIRKIVSVKPKAGK